jgi:HD superfamily phosphodiesterase
MDFRSAIKSYVLETFGERSGALVHTKRVYRTALSLSSEFDSEVLFAACYLHDINVEKPHPKKAVTQAEKFLMSIDYPPDKREEVLHAIAEHGYYGNPDTKEGFMLSDADQLDAMGLSGFGQFSEFSSDPEEMERVLKSIEKECLSVLHLAKSKELAKERIEHRKKIIEMMREEQRIPRDPSGSSANQ